MPDNPSLPDRNSLSWRRQLVFGWTASVRFGRSKPWTMVRPCPWKSLSAISMRVALSAVAVNAAMVASGKCCESEASCSYSRRKLGPHLEMQCASSMTNRPGPIRPIAASMRGVISRSGER